MTITKTKKMKNLLTITLMVIALAFTTESTAQKFSGLDKSPADIASYPSDYKVSQKLVRITYSRPQLKGRSISELAPVGKVWRTGANEAPEITFYKDAKIGGKSVAAGTYSLFTLPGEKEWTIILNKNLNQWGAYSYEEADDVIRVPASVSTGSESLDAFSIAYKEMDNGTHMVFGWGNTRVSLPITF